MSTSRQTRHLHKRVKIHYDNDSSGGDACRDITITQSVAGHILQSTTTEGMSDSTDPWTKGFFDNNSEAFVVNSLPDELQDIGPLDSQLGSNEEIKDQPKVLTVVYFYYSFTDKAIM
jgi:hypothetical protein